jgi:glyoxylase-like metal-dependent hydrolase (beta-lactamase superfamily II)
VDFVRTTYAAIEDRLELVECGAEFLPGFRLIPATGHRRHHSVVQIESEGERLLHLSDAVVHPLFMAVREWASTFDSFPEEAIQDKIRLLNWAADQQALVFGAHFPFPGVGKVRRQGESWAWLPAGGHGDG